MGEIPTKHIDIKSLTARKAIEHILDNGKKKKGNYSCLIFLGDSPNKLVSLKLASSNRAHCVNEVCKQTGLKWTIYFYAGELDYPMLVVGTEKGILSLRSAKDNVKNSQE